METLYDRLGDLLSETLSAGRVKFVKKAESEIPRGEPHHQAEPSSGGTEHSAIPHEKKSAQKKQSKKERLRQPSVILRKLSQPLERAYRLLGISPDASAEEIRQAYKSRLKYFHPDRHQENAVLQKVATDKTRQVVEAYELIQRERGLLSSGGRQV